MAGNHHAGRETKTLSHVHQLAELVGNSIQRGVLAPRGPVCIGIERNNMPLDSIAQANKFRILNVAEGAEIDLGRTRGQRCDQRSRPLDPVLGNASRDFYRVALQ